MYFVNYLFCYYLFCFDLICDRLVWGFSKVSKLRILQKNKCLCTGSDDLINNFFLNISHCSRNTDTVTLIFCFFTKWNALSKRWHLIEMKFFCNVSGSNSADSAVNSQTYNWRFFFFKYDHIIYIYVDGFTRYIHGRKDGNNNWHVSFLSSISFLREAQQFECIILIFFF